MVSVGTFVARSLLQEYIICPTSLVDSIKNGILL